MRRTAAGGLAGPGPEDRPVDSGEASPPSHRPGAVLWCPRPDLNRHALRLGILSPLCLPFHHAGREVRGGTLVRTRLR
jgi:hypothetical protein